MTDKNRSEALENLHITSSKDLLYSEYVGSSVAEHAIELLENKKSKPNILFERSSVLQRIKKFLPVLEQCQNELHQKSSEENDIETVKEGASYVQMDVVVVNPLKANIDDCDDQDDELEDFESCDEDQYDELEDFESCDDESYLSDDSTIECSSNQSNCSDTESVYSEDSRLTSELSQDNQLSSESWHGKRLISVIEDDTSESDVDKPCFKKCKRM